MTNEGEEGPLPMMGTKGNAASTQRVKSSAQKCFDKFVLSTQGRYFGSLDTISPSTLCDQTIWLEFAHFLVYNCANETTGKPLVCGTIVEYLRKCMGVVREVHGLRGEHKEFFAVLDVVDDKRNWLKGAIRQIQVEKFKEAAAQGDTMSSQASAIYLLHRRDISRALRSHGTQESLQRNCILQINGNAAGRPSEVASLSPDVMVWDPLFECAVAMWPQLKTHKHKLVALTAGAERMVCALNALACAHASGCFKDQRWNPDEMNYFFEKLAGTKSVTTAITNTLRMCRA